MKSLVTNIATATIGGTLPAMANKQSLIMQQSTENLKLKVVREWLNIIFIAISTAVIYTSLHYFNTYTFVWIAFFVLITYSFYKKYLKTGNKENREIIVCIFFAVAFLLFVINSSPKKPFLYKSQYVGIYIINDNGMEENETIEKFLLYDIKHLFENQAAELLFKNENLGKEYFIYWQTGVSEGFTPYKIQYFNGKKNIISYLENFLNIGLVAFLEILLKSIKYILIFLCCFLISHLYIRIKQQSEWQRILIPTALDE